MKFRYFRTIHQESGAKRKKNTSTLHLFYAKQLRVLQVRQRRQQQ